MVLSAGQMQTLGDAAALIGRHGAVLSAFELETLTEVAQRFGRTGRRDADVTESEWAVIELAVDGMKAEARRQGWAP
jgi:hypothetical protein